MYRLAILDVDGVLTRIKSSWQYIHSKLGLSKLAKFNKRLYELKLINYREWAILDTSLWYGYRCSEIFNNVPITPGAFELLKLLKSRGLKVVLISGGLDYVVKPFINYVDEYYVNKVICIDDVVQGVEVLVEDKKVVIDYVLSKSSVNWSEVIAIGDSEIDLYMIKNAGLSIAFNPTSSELVKYAKLVIYSDTLFPVIEILDKLLS